MYPSYRMRDPYMGRAPEAPAFIPFANEFLEALKMRDKRRWQSEAMESKRVWDEEEAEKQRQAARDQFLMKYEYDKKFKPPALQREFKLGPSPEDKAHEIALAKMGISGRKDVAGIRKATGGKISDKPLIVLMQEKADLVAKQTAILAGAMDEQLGIPYGTEDEKISARMQASTSYENAIQEYNKAIATYSYELQPKLTKEQLQFGNLPVPPPLEDFKTPYQRQRTAPAFIPQAGIPQWLR